jgi:hypothetical protein
VAPGPNRIARFRPVMLRRRRARAVSLWRGLRLARLSFAVSPLV